MFLSLHCNSALSESAHGVEVYYFTPFSQPLAKSINDKLSNYYDNSVYGDGTWSSRGEKYSYYWVTLQQDFPSVLVEMGFISNERECMVMADPTYQSGIAQSIADGVKAYFARSGLSYSGSGSSEAPDNSGANTGETPSEPENPGTGDTTEPETPVTPVPDDNTSGTDDSGSSDTSEPDTSAPDTSEPEQPDAATTESSTSETSEPETSQPDPGGIRVE